MYPVLNLPLAQPLVDPGEESGAVASCGYGQPLWNLPSEALQALSHILFANGYLGSHCKLASDVTNKHGILASRCKQTK